MSTRQRRHRATAWVSAMAVLGGSLLVVLPIAATSALTIPTAGGSATGEAIQFDGSVTNPDPALVGTLLAAHLDVGLANSNVDTAKLAGSDAVGNGEAVPLRINVPGALLTQFSNSDSHAPSSEVATGPAPVARCTTADPSYNATTDKPDSASKAQATAASLFDLAALASLSTATGDPKSFNCAVGGAGQLLPGPNRPLLSTTNLEGIALVKPASPSIQSSGHGAVSVNFATVSALGAPVNVAINILTADATAHADGSTGSASATCTILQIVIGATKIDPLDCSVPQTIPVNPLVDLKIGQPLFPTVQTPTLAKAGIVAVTIVFKPLGPINEQDVRLGVAQAESHTGSLTTPPPGPCGPPPAITATKSGSAAGDGVQITDAFHIFQADAGQSNAAFDLGRTPFEAPDPAVKSGNLATADGNPFMLQVFRNPTDPLPPPVDPQDLIRVAASSSANPPGANIGAAIATFAPGPPIADLAALSATALSSNANTTSATAPHGDASAASLSTQVSPPGVSPVPLSTGLIRSASDSKDPPGTVTSTASEEIHSLDTTVGGIRVQASVVATPDPHLPNGPAGPPTSATATVGAPGTATTSYNIASLVVNGTTIDLTDVLHFTAGLYGRQGEQDIVAGPITVRVIVGEVGGATLANDPTAPPVFSGPTTGVGSADISVNPVRIVIPSPTTPPGQPTGLANQVILGHTEAHASAVDTAASQIQACKDVDIHWDGKTTGGASYGDNGSNVVPHQKMWYRLCAVNNGAQDVTGAVFTDPLDPNLSPILFAPGLPPGVHYDPATNTLTTDPFTITAHGSRCFEILVEVDQTTALDIDVKNHAVLTTSSTMLQTNEVVVHTKVDPTHPALSLTKVSSSFNPITHQLTATMQEANLAGAEQADNVIVTRADSDTPGVTVDPTTPLPIPLGNIAQGTSKTFTVVFDVPPTVHHFLITFRELTTGHDDQLPYSFD